MPGQVGEKTALHGPSRSGAASPSHGFVICASDRKSLSAGAFRASSLPAGARSDDAICWRSASPARSVGAGSSTLPMARCLRRLPGGSPARRPPARRRCGRLGRPLRGLGDAVTGINRADTANVRDSTIAPGCWPAQVQSRQETDRCKGKFLAAKPDTFRRNSVLLMQGHG